MCNIRAGNGTGIRDMLAAANTEMPNVEVEIPKLQAMKSHFDICFSAKRRDASEASLGIQLDYRRGEVKLISVEGMDIVLLAH